MKARIFYDPETGINAMAASKVMGWRLIRNECQELGIPVPTLDKVYESVPLYLWDIFVRILGNDGLTNVQASMIYERSTWDFPDFLDFVSHEFSASEEQAGQLYRESQRTRDDV